MLPFLFENTAFEIPTYYVLYLLGFLIAIYLATRRARRFNLSPLIAVDSGIVAFITGVGGARLVHILVEAPAYYLENPIRVFYLWQGGFVFYGGLIFGSLCVIWFLRRKREPVVVWADAVAPV